MMANKNTYSKHFVALAMLFILGNACITAPMKNTNEFGFLAYLVSVALAFAVFWGAHFLPINRVTLLPIWLLAFYCTADAFITFVKFISYNLLPDSPRILIVLPFVSILVYLGFQKTNTFFKFSLVSGIFSFLVIVFFFFSTLKDFNLSNIYIYQLPSLKGLWRQILPFIKTLVLPMVLLGIFSKTESIEKTASLLGVVSGFISFAICFLNSVLLFGIEFSGRLSYPYSSAGSTVTFGYLFTRLDGFLYFVYLATCIVKCTVGIMIIKKSRNKIVP